MKEISFEIILMESFIIFQKKKVFTLKSSIKSSIKYPNLVFSSLVLTYNYAS